MQPAPDPTTFFKSMLRLSLLSILLLIGAPRGKGATSSTNATVIPAFDLQPNPITLAAPTQPGKYFDKIGRRCALMGHEDGSFEFWVWPWKVLRGFHLDFFLGTSTAPIRDADVVRRVRVTPAATVLTYTEQSFTVKEIFLVPNDKRGAIVLLDVDTSVPLTLVTSFYPVLQPAWPAGIGGQYSYWTPANHAFVISETRRRALFLVGCPDSRQMSAPPAHRLAEHPLQFRISVQPGETDGKFIPIVIAGGDRMTYPRARTLYNDLLCHAQRYYDQNRKADQGYLDSTLQVATPDPKLNLAFNWGKIALHDLLVKNPNLGEGLVAGYDESGSGGRPGFAWFFGGDTFLNSLSFDSFQDFATVRKALEFEQRYQRRLDWPINKGTETRRQEEIGKIAHEISQSAQSGLIDWFNDYPYAYIHADTTAWYLVTMGDYFRCTGDIAFVKKSWPSILNAYHWCLRKDSDHDGLMDLKGAGMGSLEFGPYLEIYADTYTSCIWTKAIEQVRQMAAAVGDSSTESAAAALLPKAKSALETKFWLPKQKFYAYGATQAGKQVPEKTPWPAIGIAFGVLDPHHSEAALERMNDPDLCTDWATRSLAPESKLYNPVNYNYGAAWPFLSSFFTTAQYHDHFNLAGYRGIQAVTRHVFEYGLGVVPEVFSGLYNQKLGPAVNDQGFSVSGYMLPLLRGLLGLKVDAARRTLYFRPQMPANWNHLQISHLRVGPVTAAIRLTRSDHGLRLEIRTRGGKIKVVFEPALGLGAHGAKATLDGDGIEIAEKASTQAYLPQMTFSAGPRSNLDLNYHAGPGLYLLALKTAQGERNHSMKVLYEEKQGATLLLHLAGVSGQTYSLGLRRPNAVASVRHAALEKHRLVIPFSSTTKGAYTTATVEIRLAK